MLSSRSSLAPFFLPSVRSRSISWGDVIPYLVEWTEFGNLGMSGGCIPRFVWSLTRRWISGVVVLARLQLPYLIEMCDVVFSLSQISNIRFRSVGDPEWPVKTRLQFRICA